VFAGVQDPLQRVLELGRGPHPPDCTYRLLPRYLVSVGPWTRRVSMK